MLICNECLEEVEDSEIECDGICRYCHDDNQLQQLIYEEELEESRKYENEDDDK